MTPLPSPFQFPPEVLASHTGVLGKTGSGKTSTAKLLVEQVAAAGARVCILDPIKSDWWGLTSSADGKHPGLPFHILGGPRAHVPLHEGAGKAIAEIVAGGELPLSILDMADFGPGGQVKFFADFAPVLLRKMRGVLYLVMEEAHMFAPKERSGMGAENMSIHWSKTLGTAGRSKGVRLIVATQRVQSLHNAVLGSCETVIAHRLTLPADQKPVIDWLKANTNKKQAAEIAGGLSQLSTGTGWFCCGEAKAFERVKFPRIWTYDNTATPTDDTDNSGVETAPVDADMLRAIIGDAIEEAAANDPAKLRARIAELEQELKTRGSAQAMDGLFTEEEVQKRIAALHLELAEAQEDWISAMAVMSGKADEYGQLLVTTLQAMDEIHDRCANVATQVRSAVANMERQPAPAVQPAPAIAPFRSKNQTPKPEPVADRNKVSFTASPSVRKILDEIHRSHPVALTFAAAAARAVVSKRSSAYSSYEKAVRASPEIVVRDDGRLTSAPGYAAPATPGEDPIEGFKRKLPPSYASMLHVIAECGGRPLPRERIASDAGVSPTSSGVAAGLNELVALGLIVQGADKQYSLHPDLVGAR